MDSDALGDLLARQDGTVARRQLVADVGVRGHDIDRMCRGKDLVRVVPGVYVDHTGRLSWTQRAWVAVHALWPAALGHRSALPSAPGEGDPVIHVLIDRKRTVLGPPGVRVQRTSHLDQRVDWLRCPPRQRLPEATLDVWQRTAGVAARFRVLADVCQTRQTTPVHLQLALAGRARFAGRAELEAMLADLTSGACSVLERGYLDLERRHRLPAGERQEHDRLSGGSVYRDVRYAAYDVVVELDGRAFHTSASARDRDHERDLDSRVADETLTVRLTYGQVFDRGCATIDKVGLLLRRRGWPGPLVRCAHCPK